LIDTDILSIFAKAAACPAGAITPKHFTTQQMLAQIEGLFRMPEEESVELEMERVRS
jgi:hypothetical protein